MKYLLLVVMALSAGLAAYPQNDSIPSVQLKDVTVTARPQTVKTDGSLTTIRISGTPYAEIGSVSDMLSKLPGLVDLGNGIEVPGSGKPLFIIDGRELQSDEELRTLPSDNIKDVKIEKSPDSRYSANVKAVVYITTKKSLNDYLFLQVSNYMTFRRRISEAPTLNVRGKFANFTSTLSYSFGHYEGFSKETYFRNIDTGSSVFKLEQPRKPGYTDNSHSINWSGEYQFGRYNYIGMYYYMNYSDEKTNETGWTETWLDGTNSRNQFLEKSSPEGTLHSFTLLYKYIKGYATLHISQDYATRNRRQKKQSFDGMDDIVGSDRESDYDVLTTNIRFGDVLPWRIGIAAGAKYNYVDSRSTISSSGETSYEIPSLNALDITEHNPQAYISLGRQFGNFQVVPGLRYEYTSRSVVNTVNSQKAGEVRQHYSNMFPQLSLSYKGKNGLSLYAKYIRQCQQPNFSELNSGLVYHDAYSYSDGNPELKTAFSHDVRFGASFRDFELEVDYSYTKDAIENVESVVDGSSSIVRSYSINIPQSREWLFSLSYSKTIGKVDIYASGRIKLPYTKIPINGEMTDRDHVSFSGDVNVTYQLNDHFSFYSSFNQQGHRESITMTQKSVQKWDVGVSAKFFDNKLKATVEFNDILNKAHYNNITYYYNNVNWGTRGTNDLRGLKLRVSYTFLNKSIRSRAQRENDDVLYRTE